jgi:tetratricopeptide (TPR) repeat protein
VFTSREALPAPFAGETQRIELDRLSRADAVQLVERALGLDAAGMGHAAEAQRAEIELLVDAVHGHARTLALLAPALRERGPAATEAALVELIAAMERRFPGHREHSLLASVELSLRRLPPALRERAWVLAVFHGAVDLNVLRAMTGWQPDEVQAFGEALVDTGLASAEAYNHLSLNPALCPYLAAQLDAAARAALTDRWTKAMRQYAGFLLREASRKSEMAAALTVMELPNLTALLERVANLNTNASDAEATIAPTTTLHGLLQGLNRPQLLARVAQARDSASRALGEAAWGHAPFEAERTRVEQLLAACRVGEALAAAQRLHERAQAAGEAAYADADYDLAMACFLLGRTRKTAGHAGTALPPLEEARRRFEAVDARRPSRAAARMAALYITERADCLTDLGRLDEAAQAYEEGISLAEQRHHERDVAAGKGNLGTIRLLQRRVPEALAAWHEARDRFAALGEAGTVAGAWHQIGIVHQDAGHGDAAEDAYRQSLAIAVRCNDVAGQAGTLNQVGNLYAAVLGRPEDAVTHYRQAAERRVTLCDVAGEGRVRSNLANTLGRLGRLQEARGEIERAIECKRGLGHAAQPWNSWAILADIENDDGRAREARQASVQARDAYLAHRRDGGESHTDGALLAAEITRLLLAGDAGSASERLAQLAGLPDPPAELPPFVAALQAVVAGERRTSLAETPGLDYDDAAEILLPLDRLAAAGRWARAGPSATPDRRPTVRRDPS